MRKLCQGCLASDRKLAPLIEYVNIFQFLGQKTKPKTKCPKPSLCWECRKMIFNIHKFQQRVVQAQEVLKNLGHVCKIKCLSSLETISHVDHYDLQIFETFDKVKEELTDDKESCAEHQHPSINYCHVEIEPENDDKSKIFHDDDNDNTNDIPDPDIKYENGDEYLTEVKLFDYNFPSVSNAATVDKNAHEFSNSDSKLKKPKIKKEPVKKRGPSNYYILLDSKPEAIDGKMYKEIIVDQREAKQMYLTRKSGWTKKIFRGKHKCNHCGLSFYTQRRLKMHTQEYHTESYGKYVCDICERRLKTKQTTADHIQTHFRKYQCYTCKEYCAPEHSILSHIELHNKVTQCKSCGLTFERFPQFLKHYKEMHRRVYCDYCGYSRITKNALSVHILNKHIDSHKCPECLRVYKTIDKLRHHKFECHKALKDPMEAYCVECDIYFKTKSTFRGHFQSTKHRPAVPSVKKHPCPVCNKMYAKKSYMRNHYNMIHLQRSNYRCDLCGDYCLNNSSLKSHKKSKHGIGEGKSKKNKICPHCGRAFADNRVLTNHIRTHTGERPFVCEFCSAAFAQKYACDTHMKKHYNTSL